MRESIGGGWLLGVVVLFIALFSAYLAISINYTRAFKVKNYIINTIEQNEGIGLPGNYARNEAQQQIQTYLAGIGYDSTAVTQNDCVKHNNNDRNFQLYRGGYCIRMISTTVAGETVCYYKVTSFINIELPLMWKSILVPVSGETKTLYYSVDC